MNDPFLERFIRNIRRHSLLEDSGHPVVVALSGGADSVALLNALRMCGYNCLAVHCNYHLRGEESNRDQKFVEDLCCSLSVPLTVRHFDVPAYRQEHNACSVEMACRDLRYALFKDIFQESGAQAIAVGHNADDNIETVLHNLFRGTGIIGARGMTFRNDSDVIRPMLDIPRRDIEDFLHRIGMEHITDSSNLSLDYTRNRIRNKLRKVIDEVYPSAAEGLTRSIAFLSESEAFYRSAVDARMAGYVGSDGSVDIRMLKNSEPFASILLYEWMRREGMSRTQTDNMLEAADASGAVFIADNKAWTLSRGILMPPAPAPKDCLSVEDVFEIRQFHFSRFVIPSDRYTACFDATVLQGDSLSVRYWHEGDRIRPFGMSGSKKLSDIFNDAKIPANLKHSLPLLVKGNDILWVPGVRASSLFPVTDETKSYISITLKGPRYF